MGVSRLAPSPTGAQHLGNARTYLLAYWSARKSGSRLILRIEDVDSPRVKPWAVQQAIDDLRWLGIEWDEGSDVGGPNEPYIQTERIDLYRSVIDQLIEDDRVFPCTCTRKDIIEAGSAPHFDHEPPVYPGTCASWHSGNAIPGEGTYCWRFRATDQTLEFDDLVVGPQQGNPATQLGAFPVTQKNGAPSYQLAVVVDDAIMGVTEVVRGNDLVPSTFRQLDLFAALDRSAPTFAHVPLVLGADGKRLAKRHGDTRLSHYRERGIPAERIVGWAANSAGLIETEASVAAKEMIELFAWEKLPKTDLVVNSDHFQS